VNNFKNKEIMKRKVTNTNENTPLITRKQAIKKAGITALTAASVMFLTSKASANGSSPNNPGTGW